MESNNKISTFISKVFLHMFLGLLVTGLTGYFVANSNTALEFVYSNSYIFYAVIIIELIVVFAFRGLIHKVSPTVATALFYLYAFISGITFSIFFIAFEITSILWMFGLTSVLFGGLALIGYVTKKDLTKIGNFLMFGLLIAIIVSLLNIFVFKSTGLDLILTFAILAMFFGITIYDMKKIKDYYLEYEDNTELLDKVAIYGALELYLDFINILMRLLRLFGKRRD